MSLVGVINKMALEHKFINGKHFFKVYDYDQRITIMVDSSCTCEAHAWNHGVVCHHLSACLKYLWMKPKDRVKVRFDVVGPVLRNSVLKMVRLSNRKLNVVRVGENESARHRLLKEKICESFVLLGLDFVCEAIIEVGKVRQRADILVPELALVVEVVVSEGVESLEAKRKVFAGLGLDMRVVR